MARPVGSVILRDTKKSITEKILTGGFYLPVFASKKNSIFNVLIDRESQKMVNGIMCYRLNEKRFTQLTTASQREIIECTLLIVNREHLDDCPQYTDGY